MNLRKFLLGGLTLLCGTAIAQPHLGYHSDNYAGIHNITFQPADIVDSRYLVDINLVGLQLNAGNDFLSLNSKALSNFDNFSKPDFQKTYVSENLNGKAKNIYLNSNILLPSFMISLGKHSFAFQSNFHNGINVEGVSEGVANAAYHELKDRNTWGKAYDNKNFSVQAMGWLDYGLSYGREVYNKGQHYVKAAGTIKLLQGVYSAQLYSKNANVKFINDDTLDINNTDFSYGHSFNFEKNNDGVEKNVNNLISQFIGKPAIGGDIGVVYEFRRKPENFTYSMDGKDDWQYQDRNKYILKFGAAVCNIGAIPFTRGGNSASFYADKKGLPFDDFTVGSIGRLDTVFKNKFASKNDGGTTYEQSLPLLINLSADYNIWKGFYVNATASLSPGKEQDVAKLRRVNSYSLTPRFEHKWFSIWAPLSYDALDNLHVGAGVRLGPLTVGVNDITPWLGEKKVYDAGIYTMLRIPIFKDHLRDRDGDKISNRKDKCPKEAGLASNGGCPEVKPTDKDGDGVMDKDDKCPDVKGLVALNGCPDGDKDGDTVLDLDDKCPDVAGLVDLAGCPDGDKDGDGISDRKDKCPDVKGVAALEGCPDTDKDGDGVVDRMDKCPDVKGLEVLQGCPDTDKDSDGINDLLDKCPTVKGLKELNGCPDGDRDGDGIMNLVDKCPDVKGFPETQGCPRLETQEVKELAEAFENLKFKKASPEITGESYASLYKLANIMTKKPNYILEVKGHTDNTGTKTGNLTLSRSRAEAVKKYLVSKGVKAERITTEGFGDTQPLNDNKTEAERAQNRRVELILIPR